MCFVLNYCSHYSHAVYEERQMFFPVFCFLGGNSIQHYNALTYIHICGAIFNILITWSLVSGFPCLLLWQRAMYEVNNFLPLFVRGNASTY